MKHIILLFAFVSFAFGQLDPVENFAVARLSQGINASATSLTLTSGQGSRFPLTADGDFEAVIWDYSTYGWNITTAYLNSAAEIVRVTANGSDTMTIVRAQEGTTARSFNNSNKVYYITQNLTKRTWDAISDTLVAFRIFMNVNRDSINASTNMALLDSVNALRTYGGITRDTTVSHNLRINGAIQRSLDSTAALRTFANANRDSIHKLTDSIAALRAEINTLTSLDSVDIRYNLTHSGNFNATSTFYSAIDGSITGSATESSSNFSINGLGGRVVGMYFGSQTNTMTVAPTITLMQNDSGATSTSATPLVLTIPLNARAAALTNQSYTLTPWKILRYKYVSGGGSGSITLFSLSLIVRVPKN